MAAPVKVDPVRIVESVEREVVGDFEAGRRSGLSQDAVRPLRPTLIGIVEEAIPLVREPQRQQLVVFSKYLATSFDGLETSIVAHGAGAHGALRYTPEVRAASAALKVEVTAVKAELVERTGRTEAFASVRKACGVNQELNVDKPTEVLDLANQQLKEYSDPETARLLEDRGLFPEQTVATLVPARDLLQNALKTKGPTPESKGALALEVERNLLRIDVGFSRSSVIMKKFGAPAVAAKLDGRLPGKFTRRANDRSPEPVTPDVTPAPAPVVPVEA